MAAVPGAALLIAAALDHYLPGLRAAAGDQRAGSSATGCDRVDLVPLLCVGSEANNTYTKDVALLVDLGGNDVYMNSAGGAPFLPEGESQLVPVSVNVDLGGDDRYEARRAVDLPQTFDPDPDRIPVVVAQGAGLVGVGLLVDVNGNDLYSVEAPSAPEGSQVAAAVAQGAGANGIGALFDLGGDDRYEARGPSSPQGAVTVTAQAGAGGVCEGAGFNLGPFQGAAVSCRAEGLGGLLVDLGSGSDHYAIDAGSAELSTGTAVPTKPPFRMAFGQGGAWSGGAVLYDDGGKDSFLATAAASAVGWDSFDDGLGVGPFAWAIAQGAGFLHNASSFLLEGAGDTSYTVDVHGAGLVRWAEVIGQGGSSRRGLGVLEDLGGKDAYRLNASLLYDRTITVDDGCGCEAAAAEVSGFGAFLEFMGQGGSLLEGSALLKDSGGEDTYTATIDRALHARLVETLEKPKAPPHLVVDGFRHELVTVQGAAAYWPSSFGALLDENFGADRYVARTMNDTTAAAASDRAEGSPDVTATSIGGGAVAAQGGGLDGHGVLVDEMAGGEPNRFEAVASNQAVTEPEPDGAFSASRLPQFQGSGGTVVSPYSTVLISRPTRAVCPPSFPGYRGFGTWTECVVSTDADPEHQAVDFSPSGGGFVTGGLNTAVAPTIAFTDETPDSAPLDWEPEPAARVSRVPVEVSLRSPPGNGPLAGEVVHLGLQYCLCGLQGASWWSVWRVDAETDSRGVARGRIPLLGTGQFQAFYPNTKWRLVATYDGRPPSSSSPIPWLYPRIIAKPLALS